MSKKKKVLMLASVASMIDQFNMPNIQMMQKMGYEVHVACNFLEGNTCDANRIRKFQQLLTNMDVKQHQWDCPRNIGSLKKCLTAFWQLWRLTRQHHFEWMHCHSRNLYSAWISFLSGRPIQKLAVILFGRKTAGILDRCAYYG